MGHHRPRRVLAGSALAAATIMVATACGASTASPTAKAAAPAAAGAAVSAGVGGMAPAGTFTTVDGSEIDVASLRGKPTLLWFIAAGCSSCTASIPAVADRLPQLRADGVQVVVIDLYGDLGSGAQGTAALRKLGTGLVGSRFTDPAWTWGTSSKDLSFRYDQRGEPDVYYVLDRAGKITYRDGVPISTMDKLLARTHAAAQA
ncbi:MAG: hypothetical protein NVSMB13_01750 [Mycobacteriales bacterium]